MVKKTEIEKDLEHLAKIYLRMAWDNTESYVVDSIVSATIPFVEIWDKEAQIKTITPKYDMPNLVTKMTREDIVNNIGQIKNLLEDVRKDRKELDKQRLKNKKAKRGRR